MRRTAVILAMAAAVGTPAMAAPKPMAKDAKVWAAAEKARPDQLKLLEQVVNIDSGTGDVEGGRRVAAILTPRLEALGMTVEAVPAEIPGLPDNLVARLKGSGKGRILMIAHLDTVFEPGTAAKRPYTMTDDRLTGPGVGDEKGGVVQGIYALQILKELGFKDFGQITFLIETSEERGSPGTRKLIDRLLKDADVELNLEPGDPPDVITVWRKGSNSFYVDVKGRPAHAGVAPQDGRNAAVELIHQLESIRQFPTSGDGLTVNLTLMSAGARYNIIPEDASAAINIRVRDKADVEKVAHALETSAKTTVIPDTKVTIRREASFPPLPNNAATDGLADRAEAIYAGLGMQIGRGGNGGASESALANEAGVPALDGLGPVGGKFHSEDEYVDLKSVTPRLYLFTKLIMDLGRNPPARIK
ncbi:MAG: M20/M25/M40 family metallo-hydrolase [Phenylobacterium sp.]|uniref:glutamate carboxypeptidase n=1 Tax=Phenylobacterium sp. TaxID=1871053 RepID=UPI0011F6ACB4|nr:glutamate carboxypeptidase [Phenylobacterium sp.]TAJ73538.1 MAG: M20/M25/M40 family metallo-hydrolase [Phenylobacterium sp.]